MPVLSLSNDSPQPGLHYLDTSVVFALTHWHAANQKKPHSSKELDRARRAVGFLSRVGKVSGAQAITSILAFEEVAAIARHKARDLELAAVNMQTWREFKNAKPTDAAAAELRMQRQMLEVLSDAADVLGKLAVRITCPAVKPGAEDETTRLQRKGYRKLLRQHASLDPMDALHVVMGADMGAAAYLSFDNGWKAITSLTLYT